MRILDQAIEEKLYERSEKLLRDGTWEEFESDIKHMPLYLFGSGEGADFVLQKYGDNLSISKAFDNDEEKWGKELSGYVSFPVEKGIKISPPDSLGEITDDGVVLITSVRYCDTIFGQLQQFGVNKVYSLLHMEANRREREGIKVGIGEEDEKLSYANECLRLPIKNNKILLARDGLAGHGKQILFQLVKDRKDLDLVWITEKNDVDISPGIRMVSQADWKSYIEELETAKIWIFGDMIPEFAIKRQEQVYIHVKHWASITLKSFYFHLKKHLETKSIYDYYRHNTEAMDYCMVGSDFDEDTCRSGFDFDGSFIRVGSPRSDVLFQEGIRERVFKKIGLKPEIHSVIYAPTFRAINENTLIGHMRDVDLDFDILKAALERRFGGEWAVLLRIHPDVAMESKRVEKRDFVYDVSTYPDSEELVAASDIMISDYSSIMFEPAFVKKPVFLYSPDAEEYIKKDRELLLDYDSLPFPVSRSNEELEAGILEFDNEKYLKDLSEFLDKYGVHEDGHASERAAAFIENLIEA